MRARQNDLNPRIGRAIRLMARWSCSTMLLRYLHWHMRLSTQASALTLSMAAVLAADSDLFWQVVQVDGALQEAPGSSHIALGSEQEVHRIASAANHPVKVLPLAGHFDVGLVHPPTLANGVLAPTKYGGQHRHHLDRPAVHCGVVHKTPRSRIISSM